MTSVTVPVYPSWYAIQSAVVPAAALPNVAQPKVSATGPTTALGTVAPIVYGMARVVGLLGASAQNQPYKEYSSEILALGYTQRTTEKVTWGVTLPPYPNAFQLVLQMIWAEGPITSVEQLWCSNAYRQDYLGTDSQDVDPLLAWSIDGYADTARSSLGALAYSALSPTITTWTDAAALIKGRACYDPRTDSTAWTDNAALVLADFMTRAGMSIDWSGSEPAFDRCDDDVGGQARWTCNLVMDSPQSVDAWITTLRAYAHCFLASTDAGWRLVPDAPVDAGDVISIDPSQIVAGSLKLAKAPRRQQPTVVTVNYTKPLMTGSYYWIDKAWSSDNQATVLTDAVVAGTETYRASTVSLPGILSYGEAYRTAVERLNHFTLCDLSGSVTLFDEGLEVLVGDVLALTHPIGLSDRLVRVTGAQSDSPGRWKISFEEYDPAVYSDTAQSEPTIGDTDLGDPTAIPAPTGLTAIEEVYQRSDGGFSSRLRITWEPLADFPFSHSYSVRVSADGSIVWSAEPPTETYVTGALQEGESYTVTVAAVGTVATSSEISVSLTAQGRLLPPGDVPSMAGIEVAGTVRLSWPPAEDIDIWRYELRRSGLGATTETWDDMALVDRFLGLRATVQDLAPGDYRFGVKALDSVGNYSANAAYITIAVTLDNRAFFVGQESVGLSAGDATNIFSASYLDGADEDFTEIGTAVDTLFSNAADTYTDPFFSYDNSAASEWISEVWDAGASYSGTWRADVSGVSAIAGTITGYLELADSPTGSWSSYSTLSVVAAARYARVRVTAASGSSLLVATDPTVRLDVVAQEERGSITTSATAAATVTLGNSYTYAKSISLSADAAGTPEALSAVFDNVDPSSGFDVYCFDSSGAQVSRTVSWVFNGV